MLPSEHHQDLQGPGEGPGAGARLSQHLCDNLEGFYGTAPLWFGCGMGSGCWSFGAGLDQPFGHLAATFPRTCVAGFGSKPKGFPPQTFTPVPKKTKLCILPRGQGAAGAVPPWQAAGFGIISPWIGFSGAERAARPAVICSLGVLG